MYNSLTQMIISYSVQFLIILVKSEKKVSAKMRMCEQLYIGDQI